MTELAEIISFEPKQEEKCSFCKKSKSQVKRLVASQTGKSICDACIKKCTALIKDKIDG